jgi:hypothetical protein
MSVIPALRKLRQEDYEFDVSLGCKVKIYLKQAKIKIKKRNKDVNWDQHSNH